VQPAHLRLLAQLPHRRLVEGLVAHEAAGQGHPAGERVHAAFDEQHVQLAVTDGQGDNVDRDRRGGECLGVVGLKELPLFARHPSSSHLQ
jgi:hypothetical protein